QGGPQRRLGVNPERIGATYYRQQICGNLAGVVDGFDPQFVPRAPLSPYDCRRDGERGRRPGDSVVRPGTLFLGGLDRLPVRVDLVRATDSRIAEHVRVTSLEFLAQRVGDVVDPERFVFMFGGDPGV